MTARRSAIGGSMPVPFIAAMPDQGPMVRMSDGSEWIRGGVLSPAAAYPALAALAAGRVYGRLVSTIDAAVGSPVGKPAKIGATVVIAAAAGGVLRSADGGATWAIAGVVAGRRFLTITASATTFYALGFESGAPTTPRIYTSADGATWAGSGVGAAGTLTSNGVTDAAWTGTTVVFAHSDISNSTLRLWTCNVAGAIASSAQQDYASIPFEVTLAVSGLNVGAFCFALGNIDQNNPGSLSANGGMTWAAIGGAYAQQYHMGAAFTADGKLLHFHGGRLMINANMATPGTYTWGKQLPPIVGGYYRLIATPSGPLLLNQVQYTAWSVDGAGQLTQAVGMLTTLPPQSSITPLGTGIAWVYGGAYYETDLATVDYVGMPTQSPVASGNASSAWVNYMRAK